MRIEGRVSPLKGVKGGLGRIVLRVAELRQLVRISHTTFLHLIQINHIAELPYLMRLRHLGPLYCHILCQLNHG